MCELNKTIDSADYIFIKNFKDLLFKNISYPPLFGRMYINNEQLIKAELAQLINKISEKILELESYLKQYPIK